MKILSDAEIDDLASEFLCGKDSLEFNQSDLFIVIEKSLNIAERELREKISKMVLEHEALNIVASDIKKGSY